MIPREAAGLLAEIRMTWPHSPTFGSAEEIRDFWAERLAAVPFPDALGAVREMDAAGRQHAPSPGDVIRAVTQRAASCPDWDEARAEILRAIRTYRPPSAEAFRNPYAAPPAGYWSHPVIALFMEHVWDEWRMAPEPALDGRGSSEARTFYAQQRDAYGALRSRSELAVAGVLAGASRRGELRPVAEITGGDR